MLPSLPPPPVAPADGPLLPPPAVPVVPRACPECPYTGFPDQLAAHTCLPDLTHAICSRCGVCIPADAADAHRQGNQCIAAAEGGHRCPMRGCDHVSTAAQSRRGVREHLRRVHQVHDPAAHRADTAPIVFRRVDRPERARGLLHAALSADLTSPTRAHLRSLCHAAMRAAAPRFGLTAGERADLPSALGYYLARCAEHRGQVPANLFRLYRAAAALSEDAAPVSSEDLAPRHIGTTRQRLWPAYKRLCESLAPALDTGSAQRPRVDILESSDDSGSDSDPGPVRTPPPRRAPAPSPDTPLRRLLSALQGRPRRYRFPATGGPVLQINHDDLRVAGDTAHRALEREWVAERVTADRRLIPQAARRGAAFASLGAATAAPLHGLLCDVFPPARFGDDADRLRVAALTAFVQALQDATMDAF